jgi:hypothetical protein
MLPVPEDNMLPTQPNEETALEHLTLKQAEQISCLALPIEHARQMRDEVMRCQQRVMSDSRAIDALALAQRCEAIAFAALRYAVDATPLSDNGRAALWQQFLDSLPKCP